MLGKRRETEESGLSRLRLGSMFELGKGKAEGYDELTVWWHTGTDDPAAGGEQGIWGDEVSLKYSRDGKGNVRFEEWRRRY